MATASPLETEPKIATTFLSAIADEVSWAAVCGSLLVSANDSSILLPPRRSDALISLIASLYPSLAAAPANATTPVVGFTETILIVSGRPAPPEFPPSLPPHAAVESSAPTARAANTALRRGRRNTFQSIRSSIQSMNIMHMIRMCVIDTIRCPDGPVKHLG